MTIPATLPSLAPIAEDPPRSPDPLVRVRDVSHVEFIKPDLGAAESFFHDFGLHTVERTPHALYLRGAGSGHHCVIVRKGRRTAFGGFGFELAADDEAGLQRLAASPGAGPVVDLDEPGAGRAVTLRDPAGQQVRVSQGIASLAPLPTREPMTFNNYGQRPRANATQRPVPAPAHVLRLGHVVLESPAPRRAIRWYLDTLGLIVSDYNHLRHRPQDGPMMAFLRCDRGAEPADHHSLAIVYSPRATYNHSAYEVIDVDDVFASGTYLFGRGGRRTWGWGATFRAARSSTTGPTPTGCSSSTTPTATSSMPPCRPSGTCGGAPTTRSGASSPAAPTTDATSSASCAICADH
ncbi:VOC family protein (plasmid) [Mycolicibacterium psychrotolerans]|uniref:VOC family protein n=1 Tax=Mycolicibacterium psychrotolerans TaxID=216929 RepID=UPI003D67401A